MSFRKYWFLLVLLVVGYSKIHAQKLPKGFVYIKDIIPDIELELRYYGNNNFIGKPIPGYMKPKGILTKKAAKALKKAQKRLKKMQLGLKVFDAYRPQMAVDHFAKWALDLKDTKQKKEYYPDVSKNALFDLGYIAAKSGHTRGSTLDITIIDLNSSDKKELDMGYPHDFFGKESWVTYKDITNKQASNRKLLQHVMKKAGFNNYPKEWWHFTLKNEPFPETYFNFPIQ